jgi:arylsulfatase A
MKRLNVPGTVLLLLAPLASLQAAERPNFVIIMADDLGYGDIGCYGNQRIETPHLDRLAAEGMRFTDFHSSGAVCSPTRAGLMTGRYQQRAGIPGVIVADPTRPTHPHGLQDREVTFAELLAPPLATRRRFSASGISATTGSTTRCGMASDSFAAT